MRLVFLGPPGAGKGTVAALLDDRLRVMHLSSGDMLREAVRRGDPLGQEANQYMKAGTLVPDQLVTGLVLRHLEGVEPRESFVLDGFPRTVEQAQASDEALAGRGQAPIDRAINFEIAPKTVVERLVGRRICQRCGIIYHVTRIPPRRASFCDRCGGPLKARTDDKPETILKRLAVYHEQTEPLLAFYRAQGKLRVLSGEYPIQEQYETLMDLLKKEQLVSDAG